ncbi:MAG: helix-turn-helix domain-containing protein [Halothiobacillus sp.]|jgi:AraC-like DNA-binding protein|nr:helix-turn-helix domain-containing protein [Halothiobacillus sp.]
MNIFYHPFQPTLTQNGLTTFGLKKEERTPCAALTGKVHSYLQITAEKPTPYPVMPDGAQVIYFSSRGGMISGAQLKAQDVQLLEPGEYFGIWFYPGALRYFFNLNLSEITGQFVDDKYFPCSHFTRLHIDIYRHETFSERARICENWLLTRYSPKPYSGFDDALHLIYKSSGNVRIAQLAKNAGWSSRHLNRQFLQHTGLTTKSFSQIVRFQNAARQLFSIKTNSLSANLDLGYYDQPHLIRAFKKHLMSTPGAFTDRFMSDLYNR